MGTLRWTWAILCLIAGIGLGVWHPGEMRAVAAVIEGRLLDLRHLARGPMEPPADYAIVAVDDKTLGRLKQFPPPRSAIAVCVDRLTDAGAKVIALDLLLVEREPAGEGKALSTGDARLAEAVARSGRVILATALGPDVAAIPGGNEELLRRSTFSL